nr:dephospho-CoA kinase [uncultured Prevotella sp.]
MKIAITGGIGSGKSYVCRELGSHGIQVYDCDAGAKRLMRSDGDLQAALSRLVGEEVYVDGVLQKPVLAKFLLASEANKQAINDVVHPAVARDFEQSDCDWLESAILFDSGFYKRTHFDYVVCVTAPVPVRLERIMLRDHISREKAQQWIDAVMPQEELVARSDFEIVNDGVRDVKAQIGALLGKLNNKNEKIKS